MEDRLHRPRRTIARSALVYEFMKTMWCGRRGLDTWHNNLSIIGRVRLQRTGIMIGAVADGATAAMNDTRQDTLAIDSTMRILQRHFPPGLSRIVSYKNVAYAIYIYGIFFCHHFPVHTRLSISEIKLRLSLCLNVVLLESSCLDLVPYPCACVRVLCMSAVRVVRKSGKEAGVDRQRHVSSATVNTSYSRLLATARTLPTILSHIKS